VIRELFIIHFSYITILYLFIPFFIPFTTLLAPMRGNSDGEIYISPRIAILAFSDTAIIDNGEIVFISSLFVDLCDHELLQVFSDVFLWRVYLRQSLFYLACNPAHICQMDANHNQNKLPLVFFFCSMNAY